MAPDWNFYYLANLFFTGCYSIFFLVYLSRFSSEEPRNDSFRRLLMAGLSWAFFDLVVHVTGRTHSPALGHLLFRWLSFLFLFYPAAAGEMLLALITRVKPVHRALLYAPYLALYFAGLALPSLVSPAILEVPWETGQPAYWNLVFKSWVFLMNAGLLAALLWKARHERDPLARREEMMLFAGGVATWTAIAASQVLKTSFGPDFPWLANLGACFTALAAFLGIRRYGRVFSARSLYAATVQVVPNGLAHFRAGRVIWANLALARLVGLERPEELAGWAATDLLAGGQADEAGELAAGFLRDRELTLTGAGAACLVASVPLDPEDPQKGVVAVFQDLTARNKMEEERAVSQKLSGAIETAGAICHEMNQPLQAALNRMELMRLKSGEGTVSEKDLEDLAGSIAEISAISKRLQGITSYRTKHYLGDVKILDLRQSAPASPPGE